MKIFLAEDNEDNYLVVKSNIRKLKTPVELLWAKNGKEAIEMLQSQDEIAVFLLDIEMPFINGLETAKWIRKHSRFDNTPIIAVTASVFEEMKAIYLEEGFDAVLEKPFSRKDFLQMLQKTNNIS